MLKTCLVIYDRDAAARAALDAACWLLGDRTGKIYVAHSVDLPTEAPLTGRLMTGAMEEVALLPPLTDPVDLERERRDRMEESRQLLEAARGRCAQAGIECEVWSLTGPPEQEIPHRAECVDLLAMGRPGLAAEGAVSDSGMMSERRIESLVGGACVPALVVASPFVPPQEVLLLYHAESNAPHSAPLAVDLAERTGLPIRLLTVAESATAAAEQQCNVRRYLSDHRIAFQAEAMDVEDRAESCLVRMLNRLPESIVVMGVCARSRVRQWLQGSVARAALTETRHTICFTH
jgi:nucleotide-binding universal stress UspA family protein